MSFAAGLSLALSSAGCPVSLAAPTLSVLAQLCCSPHYSSCCFAGGRPYFGQFSTYWLLVVFVTGSFTFMAFCRFSLALPCLATLGRWSAPRPFGVPALLSAAVNSFLSPASFCSLFSPCSGFSFLHISACVCPFPLPGWSLSVALLLSPLPSAPVSVFVRPSVLSLTGFAVLAFAPLFRLCCVCLSAPDSPARFACHFPRLPFAFRSPRVSFFRLFVLPRRPSASSSPLTRSAPSSFPVAHRLHFVTRGLLSRFLPLLSLALGCRRTVCVLCPCTLVPSHPPPPRFYASFRFPRVSPTSPCPGCLSLTLSTHLPHPARFLSVRPFFVLRPSPRPCFLV